MSLLLSTEISKVKRKFEGGNSLSVDWDLIIEEAVDNVMENCRPETLKRRVPIYGGLTQDLFLYYAPTDILVPGDLYLNDALGMSDFNTGESSKRKFGYVPPKVFYRKQETDKYTIEDINTARFIVIRHGENQGILTVDAMNAVGTKTGGTPTLNEFNYLQGAASVEATFTSSGVTLSDTLTTALDITDYKRGVAIIPCYLTDKTKLSSLVFRIGNDSSNYYQVSTANDSISSYLVDGWNFIRFELANRSTTGSVTDTAADYWAVVGTTTSGNTLTIIFDKITIQKAAPYYLEYYSNAPFISGSSSAYWQTTVSHANADSVNFNRDIRGIFHYEMCIITQMSSSLKPKEDFAVMLRRKYEAYWDKHPSSEEPLSYSKSPEIELSQDPYGARLQPTNEELD